MPATIHLADGTTINREDALASQKNVVARNAQFNSLIALSMGVWKHRPAVATLVAMHIGVGPECVEMAHPKTWKRGGFNLIVPMLVKDNSSQGTSAVQVGDQVILRIPTPAKVGEKQHPGSVADKLRCETASWGPGSGLRTGGKREMATADRFSYICPTATQATFSSTTTGTSRPCLTSNGSLPPPSTSYAHLRG